MRILPLLALCLLQAGCWWDNDNRRFEIVVQPADATVAAGTSATFSVSVRGKPGQYQWRRDGVDIPGATAANHTTGPVTVDDDGALFSVVVTSGNRTLTSRDARLTVQIPPAIVAHPQSVTVAEGETATFTVTATGSGTLTYQWRRNGVNIAGATSASYTSPATVAGDDGALYTVVVTGAPGSVTSNAATLSVTAAPPPPPAAAWGAALPLEDDRFGLGCTVAMAPATGDAVATCTFERDGDAEVTAYLYDHESGSWSGSWLVARVSMTLIDPEFPEGPPIGTRSIHAADGAISPSGEVIVAWSENRTMGPEGQFGEVWARRYSRASNQSGDPKMLTRVAGGVEPRISWIFHLDLAVDAAGNAVVAWLEGLDVTPAVELVSAAYFPVAAEPEPASPLELVADDVISGAPVVVMDAAGRATVAWVRQGIGASGNQKRVVVRRHSGGWSGTAILTNTSDPDEWIDGAALAVEPVTGELVLAAVIKRSQNGLPDSLYVLGSLAGSEDWHGFGPMDLGEVEIGQFSVALNDAGEAVIAWTSSDETRTSLYARRIDLAGQTYGAIRPIVTIGAEVSLAAPGVAIDHAGNVTMVYEQSDGFRPRMRAAHLFADGTQSAGFNLSAPSRFAHSYTGGVVGAYEGTVIAWWTERLSLNPFDTSVPYVRVYR